MSASSSVPEWRWRRAAQVPREFLTGARLLIALTIAFIARSATFFVGEAVALPEGLAAIVTLVAVAIFLLFVPAPLPLEMRSAGLVQVAVGPVRSELDRLPAVMRLAAFATAMILLLPLFWLLADLPHRGAAADDVTNLLARAGFPLVGLFLIRHRLPGIWRRHRRF